MKYLIGKNSYDGHGYFKLTIVNGRKVNLLSRQTYGYEIVKFNDEAKVYIQKLSKYINDNSINIYPFYDGTNEINYIGINDHRSQCIAFSAKDVHGSVIRDGGYVLYSEKYSKTAETGYGELYYFGLLDDACKKGLSIVKEFFSFNSDKMQPEEEINKTLHQRLSFFDYLYGAEVDISIFKVTTLPKEDRSYPSASTREIIAHVSRALISTYNLNKK